MQRGFLPSLDLSLGGVVCGSPVLCSGVFINASSGQGGLRGCPSVGGPCAESTRRLALTLDGHARCRVMHNDACDDACDEKEKEIAEKEPGSFLKLG